MGKSETEIFLQEWLRANNEEERRKKRMQANFILASEVTRLAKEEEYELEKTLKNSKTWAADPDANRSMQRKAKSIALDLKFIRSEKKRADDRVRKISNLESDDLGNVLVSQLIIALHQFSISKDRTLAASLAGTIRADLNKLKASPELLSAAKPSKELLKQAEMAVSMGDIIETGLAALALELHASTGQLILSQDQKDLHRVAILKMEIVDPASILEINSPELAALKEAEEKTGVHAHSVYDSVRRGNVEKDPKENDPKPEDPSLEPPTLNRTLKP